MPLAPYAARREEEEACDADAQQEVSSQQGNRCNVPGHPQRESDGVGGEDGAETRREDGGDGEDEGDEIALP